MINKKIPIILLIITLPLFHFSVAAPAVLNIPVDKVIAEAEKKYHGKVIGVQPDREEGVYRVRLLSKGGRVKTVLMKGIKRAK